MRDKDGFGGGDSDLRRYISMDINDAFYDSEDKIPVFSYHHKKDAFIYDEENKKFVKKTRELQLLTIFQGILNLIEHNQNQ